MAYLLRARPWASERGAEVIEFAIILPLLLLIIFGIVDFGFLFQRYVVMTNAAMEGARVRVLPNYTNDDAIARATAYGVEGGIPDASTCPPYCVDVQVFPYTNPGGVIRPSYKVTINYIHQYQYMGPIASLFGGSFSSTTLRASSTMRSQVP